MKYSIVIMALCLGGTSIAKTPELVSDTISEVFHAINTESYYPLDIKKATIKALDTFSKQVDEYTRFLGPEAYKELLSSTSGDYYGIGIELGPKKDEDFLMILQVKPGSPAEKVGIKRYDKILGIDGTPIGSEPIEDNIKKLRGTKRYEPVTLTIARNNKILTLKPKRDLMQTNTSFCAYLPEQRIIYCHISLFTHAVASHIRTSLQKTPRNTRGIILDLRDNTGGVLKAAVDCAGLFLPKGTPIVSIKNNQDKVLETYSTTSKPLMPKVPIIILVNQYTASSAEILARALQCYSETGKLSPFVFVVGTQTYGKGSIQDVRPIGSDCALKLTTAMYYMPDNTTIEKRGVTPDIIIKQRYPASEELKRLNKLYSPHKVTRKLSVQRQDLDTLRLKVLKKDHQILSACNILMLLDQAPKSITTHGKALSWLRKNYVVPKAVKPRLL